MKNLFLPYQQSVKLKELGFDEPCFGTFIDKKLYYNLVGNPLTSGLEKISAPLYQQALSFFVDEFGLYTEISVDRTTEPKWCFTISKFIGNPKDLTEKEWGWEEVPSEEWFLYRTQEEAQVALIDRLIELTKQ